jgi:hypothetical protein
MAAAQDQTGKSSWARWLPALVGAIGVAVAPPTALLAAVLLLPAVMAWIADTTPGRPSVRAVLLFGLAASCGPFDLLWRSGHRLETAVTLIGDLRVIALAWSAQAGGWLITQLLPLAISVWLETEARTDMARLERRKHALAEEWVNNAGF